MKIFLQPFSLFKKNIWQLMAQESSLSIGYLFGRLAQEQCGKVNCVRPDMILAFVRGLKTAIKHINGKKNNNEKQQQEHTNKRRKAP